MNFRKPVLTIFWFALFWPVVLFSGQNDGEDTMGVDVTEENRILFDEDTPKFDKFPFDIHESKRLRPKANDFELERFEPMSNRIGERWVLITVKNTSSGRRFLKSEHIVATLANAKQTNPAQINESVDPGETITKTIFFGVHQFPILMLEIQP
jgi:hypothetical protein